MLVMYLITRPKAALFLKHIFVVALCSRVVLVKVCYACEVFDHAAFGRVIYKPLFEKPCVVVLSL